MPHRIIFRVAVFIAINAGCTHAVIIDSEPSGAEIRMNGERLGVAPVTYHETTGWERLYDLEATKPGYRARRIQVRQTAWHVPMTATVGVTTGLWVAFTAGFGALVPLPLVGIFWARQLPDRIVVPLDKESVPPSTAAPPSPFGY